MNDPTEHPVGQSRSSIPQPLSDDLGALYGPGVPVPPELDEAVVDLARRRLAGRRRSRMVLRLARVGAAAAAAIALAVWVVLPEEREVGPPAREAVAVREDIDRNGAVDILDAFTLARHIEAAGDLRDDWDINGDGHVDRADVNAIAMTAVRLDRG